MDEITKPRRAGTALRRRGRNPDAMVTPTVQAKIGEALRDLYDGMKAEPIPDRLSALLRQLEQGDASAQAGHETPPEGRGPE